MKEMIEFRINEDYASRLFTDDEGVKLGMARRVVISTDDPRFARIGELNKEIKTRTNTAFFFGRRYIRQYTSQELAEARLFTLTAKATFEPAGEECGTIYDESAACPECGSGALQASDLWLDLRKVPKGKEIAITIADEIVVSQRFAEKMTDAGLTGFEFREVRHKVTPQDDPLNFHEIPGGQKILRNAEAAGVPHPSGKFWVWLNRAENRVLLNQARAETVALQGGEGKRRSESLPTWHQLIVTSSTAEIVAPTRVGIDPFDDDPEGQYVCPLGDLIGLNLLSEASISVASRGEDDIICSRQFIGVRRGLLRPRRVIFISQKFRNFLKSEGLKGIDIEVAHLR